MKQIVGNPTLGSIFPFLSPFSRLHSPFLLSDSPKIHWKMVKDWMEYPKMEDVTILVDPTLPDVTPADLKVMQANRQWRINFMDDHNLGPSTLAKSMWPTTLTFNSEAEYKSYIVEVRIQRKKAGEIDEEDDSAAEKKQSTSTAASDDKEINTAVAKTTETADATTNQKKKTRQKKRIVGESRVVKEEEVAFRALTNKLVHEMAAVGLSLEWNKTKKHHWVSSFRTQEKKEPKLIEARFKVGGRVQLYCTKCLAMNRLGLVVNIKFEHRARTTGTEEKASKKKASKKKEDDESNTTFPQEQPDDAVEQAVAAPAPVPAPNDDDAMDIDKSSQSEEHLKPIVDDDPIWKTACLRVEELYYHSSKCDCPVNSSLRAYHHNEFVDFQIPFDWVFGSTYNAAIARMNEHPIAGAHWQAGLDKKTRDKVKDDYDGTTIKRSKTQKWQPLGELINFGEPDYDFDDRFYLLLPGIEVKEELNPQDHKKAMARLIYVIVAQLGAVEDFSPFMLDLAKAELVWKHKARKTWLNLSKLNPHFRLQVKEASLLGGGNERRIAGYDPIQQWLHRDGNSPDIKTIPSHKMVPASIFCPLEQYGREIYRYAPDIKHDVKLGNCMVFRADMIHGGTTERNRGNLSLALHAHIDAKEIPREQALLQLHEGMYFYLPKEHINLYSTETVATYFMEQEQKMGDLFSLLEDTKRAKALAEMKQDQKTEDLMKRMEAVMISINNGSRYTDMKRKKNK
jgi:hypothetical protein